MYLGVPLTLNTRTNEHEWDNKKRHGSINYQHLKPGVYGIAQDKLAYLNFAIFLTLYRIAEVKDCGYYLTYLRSVHQQLPREGKGSTIK